MDSFLSLWSPADPEERNVEFLAKTPGFLSGAGATPFFRAYHVTNPTSSFTDATSPQVPGPERGNQMEGLPAPLHLTCPCLHAWDPPAVVCPHGSPSVPLGDLQLSEQLGCCQCVVNEH